MNIKKDYINKTKEYLKDLRMKLTKKEILQVEVEMLKELQSIESKDMFEYEIKTSGTYRGIEDLIISHEIQIECKEKECQRISRDIKMYGIYSKSLADIEKNILQARYLDNEKEISFSNIAKKLSYSKSSVASTHDKAIEKLAFYIFGDTATYI